MTFNFKNFARFTWLALFRSKGTHYRLTPKRIGVLAIFYAFFSVLETVTWACFLLDEVFFAGYRREKIEQPVFIVGNPRSGTTFLQRLLAKDTELFSCMRMWEILFAPSITQRKILSALAALDRRVGSPLHRRLAAREEKWREEHVAHRMALRAPEEDQYLFFHIWSTLAVWLFSAILDGAETYIYFDAEMPRTEKERIMTFYRHCIQRHLHAHDASHKHYLSKNPSSTPKVDTLFEFFPDAKIIYLVRNPLEMIPSYVSVMDYTWRIFADPLEEYGARDHVLDMAHHWYTYPLQRLERAPQESYIVVNFNDLVSNTEQTVAEIYTCFGLEIDPAFAQVLRKETHRARLHESKHEYSLGEMGLSRQQIVAEYEDIFDRFGFDEGSEVGGKDETIARESA